jgi:hypothetical protein
MVQGVFPAGALNPAPGGLFSAADVTRHGRGSDSWANGAYGWDSASCPAELLLADFCANAAEGIIGSGGVVDNGSWPFGIVARYECYTPGLKLEERRDLARQQAEAGTQKAVEHELWSGQIAQASNRLDVPFLMDNKAVDVSGGGAVAPAAGIAKLEQALADCALGTQGVIHLTRQAAVAAFSQNALVREGDKLFTVLGTPVIAGVGYDPSLTPKAPAQAPVPAPPALGPRPDNQWGFATGPVHVHLGAVEDIGEHLDTSNVLQVQAGRSAAAYWDSCCAAAVQIDTTP